MATTCSQGYGFPSCTDQKNFKMIRLVEPSVSKGMTSLAIKFPRPRKGKMPCKDHTPSLTGHLHAVHSARNSDPQEVDSISLQTNEDSLSFEALALRVASQQDKAAFSALFTHFAPRIKSYLLKHGLNAGLAEELAQEALITFWQKASLFDPAKARFSTWIFRIARNRMIDHLRRRKYPTVNADDHMSQMVAEERTDKPLETAQDVDLVRKALTKLSPPQRQALELSFMEELSHSQIAERLSIPLGTVKSRIRIAINALRKELGDRR